MSAPKVDPEIRFWAKVDVGLCWEWTASTIEGYGQFWDGQKPSLGSSFLLGTAGWADS